MTWQGVAGALIGLSGSALLVVCGSRSGLAPLPGAAAGPPGVELSASQVGAPDNASRTLEPGDSRSRCEIVRYTGDGPATVRLYAENEAAVRGMGTWLHVRVDAGTGPDCLDLGREQSLYSGPLNGFPTSWVAGQSVPVVDHELVTYRVTYKLASNTPDSTQGGTAGLRLVWEVRPAGQ